MIVSLLCTFCCAEPRNLVIVHTNDTHSQIEPLRLGSNRGKGGVERRLQFVNSVREKYGKNNVLYLDAGDFNQGTPYYTMGHGDLEIELCNILKIDVATLGNHEFDNGIEDLTERVRGVKCPIVCANLDLRSFELGEFVKPYVILEKAGRKIGIIGLEADLKGKISSVISDRMPQYPAEEVSAKWAEELKRSEKCDLVILLSHQGFDRDCEIAAAVNNVDIIVGGHSHTFLDGMEIVKNPEGKDVYIVTDGCWGLEMGEMHIR